METGSYFGLREHWDEIGLTARRFLELAWEQCTVA